ncbi:hypothetical protein [Parerythrobacter jejuensis]|uniref:Uncharacterized protein n=1 Tax=Parerythrobacter jejuensis TaxID=795812 RepID=A0A845ANN0_9SPHN|nr:hypothetical protein [Parerythrobacter jejuensis]MXP31069.1 hypothetical protein [Parerythrobacter jejuensis]MXP33829.1 hypothetical protein [Parerythrobacter jejuensis]
MTQISKALLLAAAMIGIALLAVAGIVPEQVAQFAPMALLAIFPTAWLGSGSDSCTRAA